MRSHIGEIHRFLFSFLFSLEIIGSKRAASILFSSDLRAALRLIRRFELLNLISRQNDQFDRICGLMSNHDKLMSCLNEEEEEDGDVLARIRDGAKAMAIARRMGDGLALECSGVRGVCIGRGAAVAYTDLLQPKAMRQSELWFKYHFICSCRQCNAWPPTYVDHTLQEISAVNCNCANLSSDHDFYRYEAIKRFTDFVDDAITEYLTFGNPKSCCDKLGHFYSWSP